MRVGTIPGIWDPLRGSLGDLKHWDSEQILTGK